jgi:hypothetical protein
MPVWSLGSVLSHPQSCRLHNAPRADTFHLQLYLQVD